ncbi:hypothetical protein [Costertonia aggregata]|uniref:Uncharacterized protein n=1 Tax=Costertonia aggregata TaxID=343403 RepID=A0A7H9AMW3_9FLAO|nr:hypothetical protein [Costertonia aggregata]QLG44768.1 hypothetical protein HYG79_05195 [Costertonia aggregata]
MRVLFLLFFCLFFGSMRPQNSSSDKKSVIVITQPNQNTVWTIPERVKLEWSTIAIDSTKFIRFFLVRDEMVVQELGSFRNIQSKNGIRLAKNIGSGNRYQVVGMELFPDDKYQVAKFVTPYFAIANPESDERKRKQELANTNIFVKNDKRPKGSKEQMVKNDVATQNEEKEIKTYTRQEFEGRKISYTKELIFDSENIMVKIWDHGREDGDIVSIYLNGVSVVSKHYLTYAKKAFDIKLNPNKANDLFLFAHNLGSSPPNTVSVEITDGNTSEKIILNSDLQSCEAVLISVKK